MSKIKPRDDLRQREPRERDETYLASLRQCTCIVPSCSRPACAAHIRLPHHSRGHEAGGAQKPHDRFSVPLCDHHHLSGPDSEEKMGIWTFWNQFNKSPYWIAAQLYPYREDPRAMQAMVMMIKGVL